ncbi:MAG: response regulator [Ignavibacteriaceae bacterium]
MTHIGIGISPEKQSIIWDAFRQASEGFGRNFEGTGLEIKLSREHTELMGGKISLNSEEGKGSEFIVELPISQENPNGIVQTDKTVNENTVIIESTGLNCKLLYVKDDNFAGTYVSRILAGIYNLDMADSADVAFKKVKCNKYDLILMDINLSRGLDGIQLTRIIRDLPAYNSTPIVAITAYAMEHEKNEFLSKGFTHYLPKPFTKIQLLRFIDKIISNPSAEL